MDTGMTNVKEAEIVTKFSEISKELEVLSGVIAEVIGRLHPILREVNNEKAAIAHVAEPQHSDFYYRLADTADAISNISARLRDEILYRLEL
jgi:hypothetical protein